MKKYFDWKRMSPMRKRYTLRLIGRCIVFLACIALLIFRPSEYDILNGWNFFSRLSVLHILWGLWVGDILVQLMPIGKNIPLGSKKLFQIHFIPLCSKINRRRLKEYIRQTSESAGRILLLWAALIAAIGLMKHAFGLNAAFAFQITLCFYVCDLVCVLIWCPFRLILKTRCCTTCRIFNWDHLMMFSPLLFSKGFYGWSLLLLSIAAWMVWEINVLLHPERFWDRSNAALLCANCADKLCTQYCKKLRST